ncbi:MAG: glycoside hydrolase family 127 protein [Prevotellaceae bacterium]|nr:glycoside hydrolase family 127 protein [Prevotellaceae bacterium]
MVEKKMKWMLALALLVAAADVSGKSRYIKTVEPINVDCPEGSVPRLPWQVWVTYSDGSHEWRQTRWDNSPAPVERQESLEPVGSEYSVGGYVIGDNSTASGFPITANVRVVAQSQNEELPHVVCEPLPLADVSLTGDNRLTSNRDLDISTLLSFDLSQQLYNYRDTYGLPTEGYTESDGWDSPTTKLKGHGTGHYMSALAFAFASATDPGQKDSLRSRIRTIVDELRACQERTFVWSDSLGRYWEARDIAPEEEQMRELKGTWDAFDEYKKDWQHYGYGYLNAIPAQHPVLIEMYRAYNNEEWVWAPYYTIHKQLAGLIDIANNIDDRQLAEKALLIAKDMGLWVWNRLHYRTYVKTDGTREERQERPGNRYEMWNMYIAGEVGGMAESLSRLSEMVADADERARLLEAASYFDAPAFFSPLSQNIDDIRTRHANQHIPMITGALRSFRSNGDVKYYRLSRNFWDMIQGRYVYAMGGVGNGEMFRQPYSQILSMNTNIMSDRRRDMYPNPDINETCCAYNLAKLTKDLNCFTPDDASLMDYYERVLYNQIVGSLNPDQWECTYQYAVGMNAIKPFGNETPQSSCCGGTGVENHVKYQEAAYFANDTCLWVGLYMPSQARWKGMSIKQSCAWPAERSALEFEGEGSFALKLRVPYWATSGFSVSLNGKQIATSPQPCSYVEIPVRQWQSGDVVEIEMPFTVHINYGPDKMDLAATGKNETKTPFDPQWAGTLMYGPLVMASPDIHNWDEAEFSLKADLSDVQREGVSGEDGTQGPLYTLSLQGRHFQPDYYQTGHSTHYLRLSVGGSSAKKTSKRADKTALQQAISLANERVAQRDAWAPYGYARLLAQLDSAEQVNAKPLKSLRQEEINAAISSLNMAINTMRPSNLAEPEDLSELLSLLTQSKNIPNKTTPLREAIDYADMVVQYVNDGSGTRDLIEKATKRLQEALAEME